MQDQAIRLRPFEAADATWLAEAHGRLYAADEGFDDSFAPLVAGILADFVATNDADRERGWVAVRGKQRLGSIFCVDLGDGWAKLRLFLLEPEARGRGLGRQLLETCLGFARAKGYCGIKLWTHESHEAACALYRTYGFTCTSSTPVKSFGVDLVEQFWELRF